MISQLEAHATCTHRLSSRRRGASLMCWFNGFYRQPVWQPMTRMAGHAYLNVHCAACNITTEGSAGCQTATTHRSPCIIVSSRLMGRRHMPHWCSVAALLLCSGALVRGQSTLTAPPPPPPSAAFRTTASNASETTQLSQLTVAAVESGSSGQPQLVQQAFLASVNATASAAGGRQTVGLQSLSQIVTCHCRHLTQERCGGQRCVGRSSDWRNHVNVDVVVCMMQVGFGGFPWTTNTPFPGRKDPNELTSSSEGIVESDGTVPQCEVTVQLSAPYNTTGGLVATVLNLIFTNWCVRAELWCTQIAVYLQRPCAWTGAQHPCPFLA